MARTLGPRITLAGVPEGVAARAAMQVRTVDGEPRPRRDRQGRPRFDRVWLVADAPAADRVGAALEHVDARDLRWLTGATRRGASTACRRLSEPTLHALTATGVVRLLYGLSPDRAQLGEFVHVESDPGAADALERWNEARSARRQRETERVAKAWAPHGDPAPLVARVRAEPDRDQRSRTADLLVGLAGRLPADGVPLAKLATDLAGDAHALDAGTTAGRAAVVGAAIAAGRRPPEDAVERHATWEAVGVVPDPWSSQVTGWRLPLDPDHPAGAVAAAFQAHGRAALLSLDVLTAPGAVAKPPPGGTGATGGDLSSPIGAIARTVWVVENPALLVALVEADAPGPVVWRAGNPSAAARLLLERLAGAGWDIAVSADFEPVGLRGARTVLELAGDRGRPWRLTAEDYDPTLGTGRFDGDPPATPWDPHLARKLQVHRARVLEEHRLDVLVADVLEGRLD